MAAAKSKPLTIDELIDAQRAMLTRSEKLTEKQIKHAEEQIKKLEEIRQAMTIQNMEGLKETLDTRFITKIKGDAQHVTLGDVRTQLKTLDKNIQEALANSSGDPVRPGRKTFPGLKVIQGGAQGSADPGPAEVPPLKNIGGKFNPNNRGNTGNFYDAFSALAGKKTVLKEGFAFDPSLKGSGIRSTRVGSKGQVADAAEAKMGRLGGAASILGNMALEKNEANIESMYSPGLSKFFANFLPPELARQPNSQPDTVNPITGSRANTRPKLVGIDGGKGKTATALPSTIRANVLNVTATTVNIKGKTGGGSTEQQRTMRGGDTIKTAAAAAAGAGGAGAAGAGGGGDGGLGLGDLAGLATGAGSMIKGAAKYALPAAVMYGAGRAVDYGAGALGVGKDEKGNDLQVDTKADDSNWNRMSMLEKAQSGLARGIEKAGDFVAPNMANQARADRVKKESEYFARQDSMLKGKMPAATPKVETTTIRENKTRIADEDVGDTLSDKQMAVIRMSKRMGNSYPPEIEAKYQAQLKNSKPTTAPQPAATPTTAPAETPEVKFRRSKMTSETIGGRTITGYERGYNLHGKKEDVEEADAAWQEFKDAKSDADAEAAATKFRNLAGNIESAEYKAKMKKISEEQTARKKNKQAADAATPKTEQGSENPPASVTPKKSNNKDYDAAAQWDKEWAAANADQDAAEAIAAKAPGQARAEALAGARKGREPVSKPNPYDSIGASLPKVDGARAHGGPVVEGKSYLVGEKGPEVIKPAESGKVIPNHKLKNLEGQDLKEFQAYAGLRGQVESADFLRSNDGKDTYENRDENAEVLGRSYLMKKKLAGMGEALKAKGIDVDAHYNRPDGAAEPKMGEVGYKSLDERYGKAKTLDNLSAANASGASRPVAPVIITNNNTTSSKGGGDAPMMKAQARNEESALARYGSRTSSFF